VITLDNSKIDVDDALIEKLLKEETTDINSILLLADSLRQLYNKKAPKHAYIREAVKKITASIIQIDDDSIDLAKTKQFAWILYMLSERTLKGESWKGENDVDEIVKQMARATSNLIKAN